ncbi:MAG: PqqD family peptide modification chaperone [Proteobacteria bacterium]|nr:PqqD family peptide modification chaperone [Pseudomonadota bacterium]
MIDTKIDTLIFRRSPASISTILEGETVILDIESGVYSGLNEVGTSVWNLLENQVTFAEIRETILAEFDVALEECSENLVSFLKELEQNKLIEVRVGTNT